MRFWPLSSLGDDFKGRTPLKVLQLTVSNNNVQKMSVPKNDKLTNRTNVSKHFQYRFTKSTNLEDTAQLRLTKTNESALKHVSLPSTGANYKRQSSKGAGTDDNVSYSQRNNDNTSNVKSLGSSPKWSRIKNKFESYEVVSKASRVPGCSARASSPSLKRTAFSTCKSEPYRRISSAKSVVKSENIEINKASLSTSRTELSSSALRQSIKSEGKSLIENTSTKVNLNSSRTYSARNIPISARSSASSLLPISSRNNCISKKVVNSNKNSSSSTHLNCDGNRVSLSSLPVPEVGRRSPVISRSKSPAAKEASTTQKELHCKLPDRTVQQTMKGQNEAFRKCENEVRNTKSSQSRLSSQTKVSEDVSCRNGADNDNKLMLPKEGEPKASNGSQGKSTIGLWIKDSSGNWVRSTGDRSEVTSDSTKGESKVAVLRNRFSSLSSESNPVTLNNGKLQDLVLCKSKTTSSVPLDSREFPVDDKKILVKCSTVKDILSSSQFKENVSGNVAHGHTSSARSSLSTSSSSSSTSSERFSCSSEDKSPDKVRKLSLVQRAVLSYEENLSLLSPETQRKLKLLGEKVRQQAYDDQFFISSTKRDFSFLNKSNKGKDAEKNHIDNDSKNEEKLNNSGLGEPIQPVRNFLHRYQNSKQLELNSRKTADKSVPTEELKLQTENKYHRENVHDTSNSRLKARSFSHDEDREKTSGTEAQNGDKEPFISVKTLSQRFCLQNKNNLTDTGDHDFTKINNVQKKGIPLLPNPSFLWRNSQSESLRGSDDDMKYFKEDEGDYHKYYVLENYYSPLDFRNRISNSVDIQNHGSSHVPLKLAGGEACYQNIGGSVVQGEHSIDDTEWTDLSDEETHSKAPSSTSSTLKRRKNKSKRLSHHKSQLQKSWSQSFRDMTNAEQKTGETQQYSKINVNENKTGAVFDTTDDSHLYEPVYESLGNYLISDDNGDNDAPVLSPDDERAKEISSSYTSLESIESNHVQDSEDLNNKDVPTLPKTANNGAKKRRSRMHQLRRHLSWSKSDIKLELSSKFNKIKIKKNSPTSTEIGLKMQEKSTPNTSPKKNTFIKCILKQKSANDLPVKKSLSPKKESAHFYVHLSMTSGKQRPFSDSCVQNISKNNINSQPVAPGTRNTSEPSIGSSQTQLPNARLRKGSSGNVIQRPKTPPPLPPTQAVAKLRNSGQVKENSSSLYKIVNKKNSLCSGSRSNSPQLYSPSHDSETPSTKDAESQPAYSDSEYKSVGSLYATIDSLSSRGKRNSVASSTSFESCAMADESGSSGASSTTYSSGFTLHIESEYLPFSNRSSGSRSSNLSLPLVKDYKSELLKSPFEEEPLYQFYHKDVQHRATMWYSGDGSESEYEDCPLAKTPSDLDAPPKPPRLQTQTSAMDLIRCEGGQRTLWCEVPEVKTSCVLETLSAHDRKIQEAMFEVITSEASYLKSLNFLLEHFVQCPEFSGDDTYKHILDKRERHILFSDIPPVRDVSSSLLADLEKRWLENIVISNVCDIIYNHASKYFSVYVKYCSNQIYQDRTLKQLKESRPPFLEVLKRLESSPICQGLDMHSFLMLPMQRITRLPLLVDAIFHRLSVDSSIYESCKMALGLLNKLVAECNEGARKMERMEEMLVISHHLDFRDCKGLGLLSASRWLVKKGELIQLVSDATSKRSFGRNTRWCKNRLFLFLFTDLLVITKRKGDNSYCVVDYCPRNMLQVMVVDETSPFLPSRLPSSHKTVFQLTMLSNSEGKTVEMLFSCLLESDRTRWINAVTPPKSENPDEKIYEEWDCPQVQCTHAYIAQQPDELSIEEADVVNVFRKMSDGWYEGERIRDGVRGWFPSSHTIEIVSSHLRARNLRQRYRLLMLSQTFLEEQQKVLTALSKGK